MRRHVWYCLFAAGLLSAACVLPLSAQEKEPNDQPEKANPIKLNQAVVGTVHQMDGHDYYTLTLPESGIVTVTLSKFPDDCKFQVGVMGFQKYTTSAAGWVFGDPGKPITCSFVGQGKFVGSIWVRLESQFSNLATNDWAAVQCVKGGPWHVKPFADRAAKNVPAAYEGAKVLGPITYELKVTHQPVTDPYEPNFEPAMNRADMLKKGIIKTIAPGTPVTAYLFNDQPAFVRGTKGNEDARGGEDDIDTYHIKLDAPDKVTVTVTDLPDKANLKIIIYYPNGWEESKAGEATVTADVNAAGDVFIELSKGRENRPLVYSVKPYKLLLTTTRMPGPTAVAVTGPGKGEEGGQAPAGEPPGPTGPLAAGAAMFEDAFRRADSDNLGPQWREYSVRNGQGKVANTPWKISGNTLRYEAAGQDAYVEDFVETVSAFPMDNSFVEFEVRCKVDTRRADFVGPSALWRKPGTVRTGTLAQKPYCHLGISAWFRQKDRGSKGVLIFKNTTQAVEHANIVFMGMNQDDFYKHAIAIKNNSVRYQSPSVSSINYAIEGMKDGERRHFSFGVRLFDAGVPQVVEIRNLRIVHLGANPVPSIDGAGQWKEGAGTVATPGGEETKPTTTAETKPGKFEELMADENKIDYFPDELEAMKKYAADPSEANRIALVKIRFGYAVALAREGERTQDQSMYTRALCCAESGLVMDKNNPVAWALVGRIYSGLRQSRAALIRAEDAFREALKLQDDPGVHVLLGQALFHQERYKVALEEFEKGIAKDARLLQPPLIVMMCSAYALELRPDAGVKFFQGVLKMDPKADCARMCLALLLKQQGNEKDAVAELQKVIRRDGAEIDNQRYALELMKRWKEERTQ